MKVLVEVPIGLHSDLVGRCEIKSPMYLVLKNGVTGHDRGDGVVTILCDAERANQIVALADRYTPFAGKRILVKPAPSE